MERSAIIQFARFLGEELLAFPFWWYTAGIKKAWLWLSFQAKMASRRLSYRILLRHLFVPLYGDYTWSGILIGVPVRIGYFIVLTIVLVVWMILVGLAFLLWIALPVIAVVSLVRELILLPI